MPPKPRVLVIDDDPSVREVVGHELLDAGFMVRSAPDGPSALALAREEMPDAVVLDLRLPGMDGREVLRRLKGFAPRLPVFVFSVHGDFPSRVADLSAADGCFAKSADLTPLIQAIGRAVL